MEIENIDENFMKPEQFDEKLEAELKDWQRFLNEEELLKYKKEFLELIKERI